MTERRETEPTELKKRPDRPGPLGRSSPAALLLALGFLGVLAYGIYAVVRAGRFQLAAGSISAQVHDVLWFSLLCGAASAATIEVAKRLFKLRGAYQMRSVFEWLRQRYRLIEGSVGAPEIELLRAMGIFRRPRYEFNLPIEQLAAQIGSAADVALTQPERYSSLLTSLAGERFPRPSMVVERSASPDIDTEQVYFSQKVQTGVDQLQIAVGERWRHYVQTTAVWASGAYGVALSSAGSSLDARPRYIAAALIIGGPLAWVLHDLTAVVERFRR